LKLLIRKLISQNGVLVTGTMTQMQTHEFKQIRVSGFEMINWKLNQLHIRWFAWLAIL